MEELQRHLEEVQGKIDYFFNNTDLLLQAFTRSSYSTQYGGESNEVLEFIGDRALDMYVVKSITDRFGLTKYESGLYDETTDNDEFYIEAHINESDITELKKEIVSNETLAKKIDKLGFAKYMYLGDSDIRNNVVNQEKVKADLFEAIIGAITIDSNWDPDSIQNSVEKMLDIETFLSSIDTEEERPSEFMLENAVTTLKELAEHGECSIPHYFMLDEQIYKDGEYWWSCTCSVESWKIQKMALASSKKEAKRYSAYLVLCKHYGLKDEYNDEID